MSAIEQLRKEWRVLTSAPGTFFTGAVIFFVAGFGFANLLLTNQLAASKELRELYAGCLRTGMTTPKCDALREKSDEGVRAFVPSAPSSSSSLALQRSREHTVARSKPTQGGIGSAVPASSSTTEVESCAPGANCSNGQEGGTSIGTQNNYRAP
jgi:hypothetical protein